jgi:hypothetical protein
MSTHYRVVAGVFVADNASPEHRHLFIAEVDSEEVVRQKTAQGKKTGDREEIVKTALEDIACSVLDQKEGKILRLPFVTVEPDTRRVRLIGKSILSKKPDMAKGGVKIWHCGRFKAAA